MTIRFSSMMSGLFSNSAGLHHRPLETGASGHMRASLPEDVRRMLDELGNGDGKNRERLAFIKDYMKRLPLTENELRGEMVEVLMRKCAASKANVEGMGSTDANSVQAGSHLTTDEFGQVCRLILRHAVPAGVNAKTLMHGEMAKQPNMTKEFPKFKIPKNIDKVLGSPLATNTIFSRRRMELTKIAATCLTELPRNFYQDYVWKGSYVLGIVLDNIDILRDQMTHEERLELRRHLEACVDACRPYEDRRNTFDVLQKCISLLQPPPASEQSRARELRQLLAASLSADR